MAVVNGNGKTKALKWFAIILTLISLMFGTNIVGGLIRDHYVSKTISTDIHKVERELRAAGEEREENSKNLFKHDTEIAVIKARIDNIDERTKEIKTDVKEIKQLIIQGQ